MRRASFRGAARVALVLMASATARADEMPVSLQAQLLQKTVTYITSLTPGPDGAVKVLVLFTGPTAARGSEGMATALNQLGQLGKYKAVAKLAPAASVKVAIELEKPQLIWVPPELDEKGVDQVLAACGQRPIVTVSGNAAQVKQGIILGFDVVEAKPRILVHLKQARVQNVVFISGLLTHSVIVER